MAANSTGDFISSVPVHFGGHLFRIGSMVVCSGIELELL